MAVITPDEQPPHSRGCSPLLIITALVIVALALYVGVQVIGVLYGIVMPPLPPVPGSASEISHESVAYGVDQWEYALSREPCSLVVDYETLGGTCQMGLNQCTREGSESVEWPALAQCSGEVPFSIFNMRWAATIYAEETSSSRLTVRREVFWIGTGPGTTPQFDLGQLSPSPNASFAP